MKEKPYLGITGFKTERDVKEVTDILMANGFPNEDYLPMFGFIVSKNRLNNLAVGGTRSPPAKELPFLSECTTRWTLPMMHYFTEKNETLAEQVRQLFSIGKMYDDSLCRAIQLNVAWPQLEQIGKILQEYQRMRIVMQIPAIAMEGLSVDDIARRASGYDQLVKWALIDPSGGTSKDFDIKRGLELMNALRESMPNTRIGIAGGLSGDNVKARIIQIRNGYPEKFCIDAQGKLMRDNQIIMGEAARYLQQSTSALLTQ